MTSEFCGRTFASVLSPGNQRGSLGPGPGPGPSPSPGPGPGPGRTPKRSAAGLTAAA